MLTRMNSRNKISIFKIQNKNLFRRSRISDKICSKSAKKGLKKLTRKSRQQTTKSSARNFRFTEDFGKEIIQEIHFTALNSPLVSPARKIFNEEKDCSMEIVD